MAKRDLLAAESLRKYLEYRPDGALVWLPRVPSDFPMGKQRSPEALCKSWNSGNANMRAGTCRDGRGYFVLSLFGKQVAVHRVIWALHFGAWPTDQIDHIDHDQANNRIENLRAATPTENSRNKPLSSANKSGVTGVRQKGSGGWIATIWAGKSIYLGTFATLAEAAEARAKASAERGFHENHGKSSSP